MNGFGLCEIPAVLQVIYFIKTLINLVKFIVPIGLIVMVMLDMGKGVISGDKKPGEIIKASGNKLLAAIIIFLIPTIVDFSMGLVSDLTSYESCWANANATKIKEQQVLWDEEVKRREEEEKKRKEEERREEEEEAKREEEEKDKSTTVSATFISTNNTKVIKTCTLVNSDSGASCQVTAPDSSYGWDISTSCQIGKTGKITLTKNVTYYECKGTSEGNDSGGNGNISTVTVKFVHSDGVIDTKSCTWNASEGNVGCSVKVPDSSHGWDKFSMCVSGEKNTINVTNDITYYECKGTTNNNLKSAVALFIYSNGKTTTKSCSWDTSKGQKNCSVTVPSSSYGWGASSQCSSGEKGTLKLTKDITYYECGTSNNDSNNIMDGAIKLEEFPNISKNTYQNFTYWLYHPVNLTKNLPVIIYLPGQGEMWNGDGNSVGTINEVIRQGKSYNVIIIVMQVPTGNSAANFAKQYVDLTNQIADYFGANKRKISVMGWSHGCFGTLNLVSKYPNYFSAVVPVGCSWNSTYYPANSFVNQPVWAISGYDDGKVPVYPGNKNLQAFSDAINAAGGNAKYTYLEGKPHNVFNNSYSILRDPTLNVMGWMISQTRK